MNDYFCRKHADQISPEQQRFFPHIFSTRLYGPMEPPTFNENDASKTQAHCSTAPGTSQALRRKKYDIKHARWAPQNDRYKFLSYGYRGPLEVAFKNWVTGVITSISEVIGTG